MSRQNLTTNFLSEASKQLPSNALYTPIRSRMIEKCLRIKTKDCILDLDSRCNACGVLFEDVPPSNLIKPIRKPKCYKKSLHNPKNYSKYQLLFYKKYCKYRDQKQLLILQCNQCKNQLKTKVIKTGNKRGQPLNKRSEKITRKKKRNINEFSGLKKSAVLSVKRALQTDDKNNTPPSKRLKTHNNNNNNNVIDLVSPVSNKKGKKKKQNMQVSDVICIDSPLPRKKLNNMFTPSVIEISDSEQSNNTPNKQKNQKKKNKKPINKTTLNKIKNNNNVVLVAEQTTADKKKKKLNNLSNYLKEAASIQKPEKFNSLQNFLNTFI